MIWGKTKEGRTPLMSKRGHLLQDKLDLDCKISKMCLKLEM